MEYHTDSLTLETEQQCEAVAHALLNLGKWEQLSDNEVAGHIPELERFTFLPTVHNSKLIDSYRLDALTFSVIYWRSEWQPRSKYDPRHYQMFTTHPILHIASTAEAGRLTLRPETLPDKINEFFIHAEIDFPCDKLFSKKHYVLGEDVHTAERLLTTNVRTSLNAVPQAVLESITGAAVLAPLAVAAPGIVEPIIKAGLALAATA